MDFTVSDKSTVDKFQHRISYSETEWYHTKNNETGAIGWENEKNIIEKWSEIVPSEYLDEWLSAVMKFINEYNSKLPEDTVTYEILDKREDGQYKYIKKLNGHDYEEGSQNCFAVPEKKYDAWDTAVRKYHKDNNIPLPSDEVKDNMQDAKDIMNPGKALFNEQMDDLPTIPKALGKMTSEPCDFPSSIAGAVKRGPVNPLDDIKHEFTALVQKENAILHISADDPPAALNSVSQPLMNMIESQINDTIKETDTIQEAFRKKYASEISDTEALLETDLDDENVIEIKENKYEIPEWFMDHVTNAMKSRFGTAGEPNQKVIDRYNEQKSEFTEIFKKYNIPEQLTLISIIESNCKNIEKENSTTASGIWQITRITGARYNLLNIELRPGLTKSSLNSDYNIISNYDKRTDITESTEAVAKILRDIRKYRTEINNWLLTAAAYNHGEGAVSQKIKKAGENADIWDIWKSLPGETRSYICLLVGLCIYFELSTDTLFE